MSVFEYEEEGPVIVCLVASLGCVLQPGFAQKFCTAMVIVTLGVGKYQNLAVICYSG